MRMARLLKRTVEVTSSASWTVLKVHLLLPLLPHHVQLLVERLVMVARKAQVSRQNVEHFRR